MCVIIPIVLVVVAIIVVIGHNQAQEAEMRRRLQEAEVMQALERDHQEEEARQCAEQKRLDREARQRKAEQTQLAVANAVNAIRKAATERYKPAMTAATHEERDQWMKDARLNEEHLGLVLTVRVLTSPTGRMALEWIVDPRFPRSLKIVCFREDRCVVFIDYGARGTFHDTLVRGRDHWFYFHAFDGDKDVAPNFGFTVKIETPRQRARVVEVLPPKPIDEAAEREQRIKKRIESICAGEQLWAEARRKEHKRIDAEGGSEPERKQKKATFDAKLLEERDREERDQG